jgi:hypothetical protein
MNPDYADSIDITTDLNARSDDAVPFHGDQVPENRGPAPVPEVLRDTPDEPPAPSLKDTLTDAFKGDKAPLSQQPPEGAPEAGQKENTGPDLVKVGDRFHRKDGSFASNAEIEAFNAVQSGQPAPPVLPPFVEGFTAVEREQFLSLPAETRQFVERTMEGVNNWATKLADYDVIDQVIGPRRQAWAAEGMPPAAALQQLFSLSDFAGKDPGQFVMWFADQHRLDLDALLDARDAMNDGVEQGDPRFLGLQNEIAELRNALTGYTNISVSQQHAQNARLVQQFTEEKDASGNLLHPYFPDVADSVVQHIGLLRQQQPYLSEPDLLKAAYDFATYNHPQIRERLQQEALKAAQDKAAAEAARARGVGVSINGGPAGDTSHAPNNANRTLREELQEAFRASVN